MKYFLIILMVVNLYANEDEKLLIQAYSYGLKPAPNNLITLKNIVKITSKEKITLGKKLFFDKNLSLNKDISCASCHDFKKGGADGIPTAIGHKNQKNPSHLNSPTVLNTAFSKHLFWNGSSHTLKDQAQGPLQATFEMSITPKLAEERVKQNSEYNQMFLNAFGSNKITFDKITEAIGEYEKTLVTRSRYDEFLEGDLTALNKEEKEGLKLFITKSCVGCHNGIALGGQKLRKFPLSYHPIWSMSDIQSINELKKLYEQFLETLNEDRKYFQIKFNDDKKRYNYLLSAFGTKNLELLEKGFFNLYNKDEVYKVMTTKGCIHCHDKKTNRINRNLLSTISFPFENKGGFLGDEKHLKHFRVPLLRNVVSTAPYFHNGSVEKIEDAIKMMGTHQARKNLTDEEIEKIVKFLKAVNGQLIDISNK